MRLIQANAVYWCAYLPTAYKIFIETTDLIQKKK